MTPLDKLAGLPREVRAHLRWCSEEQLRALLIWLHPNDLDIDSSILRGALNLLFLSARWYRLVRTPKHIEVHVWPSAGAVVGGGPPSGPAEKTFTADYNEDAWAGTRVAKAVADYIFESDTPHSPLNLVGEA